MVSWNRSKGWKGSMRAALPIFVLQVQAQYFPRHHVPGRIGQRHPGRILPGSSSSSDACPDSDGEQCQPDGSTTAPPQPHTK